MQIENPSEKKEKKSFIDLKYVNLNQLLRSQNFKINSKVQKNGSITSEVDVKNNKTTQVQLINNMASKANQLSELFQKYLLTIKPVINNFTSLTLSLNPDLYGFYSLILSKNQVNQLTEIFQPLRNFKILDESEIDQNIRKLSKEEIYKLINKRELIYKMNIDIPPQNEQIYYWGSTISIKPFTIQGQVSKGKGLGRQQLGMPTANTQISHFMNQSLRQYPNGIYITTIKIKNKPEIYIGASSLGTNPHYENQKSARILQTYILHDFKEQALYGEFLVTEFHELIRLEFKFEDFSAFLNGMRNDIEVAKIWGVRNHSSKL